MHLRIKSMADDSPQTRQQTFIDASHMPVSLKQMLAYQIEREMARQGISRVKMATAMQTSRAVVNRLLDPTHQSVTLHTIQKAADILGKQWHIFLQSTAS
jgi:antitoxin HicB